LTARGLTIRGATSAELWTSVREKTVRTNQMRLDTLINQARMTAYSEVMQLSV
jgi:hypothetical protein